MKKIINGIAVVLKTDTEGPGCSLCYLRLHCREGIVESNECVSLVGGYWALADDQETAPKKD